MTDPVEPAKFDDPTDDPIIPDNLAESQDFLTARAHKLLDGLTGDAQWKAFRELQLLFDLSQPGAEKDEDYEYLTRPVIRADEPRPYRLESGHVYTTNVYDIPREIWGQFDSEVELYERVDNFVSAICIHARLVLDRKLNVNFANPHWAEEFSDITIAIQEELNRAIELKRIYNDPTD